MSTLFAEGPKQAIRPESHTRAEQNQSHALSTAPGHRLRKVKKGGKTCSIKIGVCRHFLQRGVSSQLTPRLAPEPSEANLAPPARPLSAYYGKSKAYDVTSPPPSVKLANRSVAAVAAKLFLVSAVSTVQKVPRRSHAHAPPPAPPSAPESLALSHAGRCGENTQQLSGQRERAVGGQELGAPDGASDA